MSETWGDTIRGFMELFAGREDAYGTGRGECVRRPLTEVQYHIHLRGDGNGLGVYPMLENNTVWFAAIDLDCPDFEFVRSLQPFIPGASWIERSRSGNAHLWVFFCAPCPAWAARGVLRKALEAGGRPNVEVFPKQDQLREGMLGNYINLPYHGDGVVAPVTRPILSRGDEYQPIALEEFVDAARSHRNSPDSWVRRAGALGILPPEARPELSEFGSRENVHPCAIYIYEHRHDNPLQPGHRHDVLFALAKQLLNWRALSMVKARAMVHEVNDAGVQPAARQEVDRIVDSVTEAGYTSTGCNEPLVIDYVRPDCPIAHG